jgi:tetratricopeptide (TPR) repeat protein
MRYARHKFWFGVGLALALALLAGSAARLGAAESAGAAFEAANKLYEEGKFQDAAAAYQKLALSGNTSAPLFFNLGNAFFKSGQIGRAIDAYHRAEQIDPRDPDLRANLRFARGQSSGPSVETSVVQQWLGRLSLNEWTLAAAAVFWVLLLLLTVMQWRPALRPALRLPAVLAGLGLLALGICAGMTFYETRVVRTAVVVAHDAIVRRGPFGESQEAFTAHDGAELRVLDQKDDWVQVSVGPGRFGWVRRDQVLLSS